MSEISFYHSQDVAPLTGTQRPVTNRIIPNTDMILYAISLRTGSAQSTQVYEPVVFRASDQALIARGLQGSHNASCAFSTGLWWTLPFASPVKLSAGVEYRIGANALGPGWSHRNETTTAAHEHISPEWHSAQWLGGAYGTSSFAYPSTTTQQEMTMRLLMEPAVTNKVQAVNMYKSAPNTYYNTGWNFGVDFSMNASAIIKGLSCVFYNTGTHSIQARLHDMNGNLLASSPLTSVTQYNTFDTFTMYFSTPYQITANTNYVVSTYSSSSAVALYGYGEPANTVYTSSKSSITAKTVNAGTRYDSGTTWPSGVLSNYTPATTILFEEPNTLPSAPTGLSVAGSIPPGGNPVASWTHNDPDSDAQSGYQIRWRRV